MLTQEQEEDAGKLLEFDLNSILDEGKVEAKCKELGQQFFDKYKEAAGDDSRAGRQAVINICNWVHSNCEDGKLRKQYIERAWAGIGDKTWRWIS